MTELASERKPAERSAGVVPALERYKAAPRQQARASIDRVAVATTETEEESHIVRSVN